MEHDKHDPFSTVETPKDAIEQHESKDVVVHLTREELDNLDELGPDNEAVKQWLEQNGINQQDRIIAHVKGQEDAMVLDAGPEDFLTRDKVASAHWNAEMRAGVEAARRTIEDFMDVHSAEMGAEQERQDRSEEIRELGEEGLDASGVVDPSDSNEFDGLPSSDVAEQSDVNPEKNELDGIERTYNSRVARVEDELATDIAEVLSKLESESELIGLGKRTILDNTRLSLQDMEVTLNNFDDRTLGGIQTRLRSTIDSLYSVSGRVSHYSQSVIGEVRSLLNSVDARIASQTKEAEQVDEDIKSVLGEKGIIEAPFTTDSATATVNKVKEAVGSSSEVKTSLSALETEADSFKEEVRKAISSLEDILHQSYSRPVESGEIAEIVHRLKQLTTDENGALAQQIGETDARFQTAVKRLRSGYTIASGQNVESTTE